MISKFSRRVNGNYYLLAILELFALGFVSYAICERLVYAVKDALGGRCVP